MRKIHFEVSPPFIRKENYTCDCCNEPLSRRNVYQFNGGVFDSLYENEHLCEDCAAVLPEVDFLAAAYAQVRDYKYLQYRMKHKPKED